MKTLVVLPTYNEIQNLAPMTAEILKAVPRTHILVVDDNSPDGTGALADDLALKHPGQVHVLHRQEKNGLGPAYLAGFAWALERDYEGVVQMDADFSHPIALIPQLLKNLEQCDMVLASRYIKGGGTRNWGVLRRFISRGGNLYARMILHLGIKDLTGGFKAYRREALEFLLACPIQSKGYHFQIETTARAVTQGYSFTEVPFIFEERRAGKSKMDRGIFFEAMIQTLKLKLRLGKARKSPDPAMNPLRVSPQYFSKK